MICDESNCRILESYLSEFGITANDEQLQLLLRHMDLVVEKNRVMNLTRIVEPQDAIIRHVVDSLLVLTAVQTDPTCDRRSFVDIGTGAGLPGIPLGIMTNDRGLLIDSVGKKVSAVQEFIQTLGLHDRLQAECVRVEDLARHQRERYDYVVARAVADLGVLVEYASPLLRKHGRMIVSKAQLSGEELQRGDDTACLVGMRSVSRETFELPEQQGHREILVYDKYTTSKVKLPRKVGMAKHHPLVS